MAAGIKMAVPSFDCTVVDMAQYVQLVILASCSLLFLLLLLPVSEGRSLGISYEDYNDLADENGDFTTPAQPEITTSKKPKPHYTKYRLLGRGDCWKKVDGHEVFRYVKHKCYFCPKGSIVNGMGDCWNPGRKFSLFI